MPELGCPEAIELLNAVFTTPLILNDGHEIRSRLDAGDDLRDIVRDYTQKFGRAGAARRVLQVMDNWPAHHLQAVSQMVGWALGTLDDEERVTVRWKGDTESPETVTQFELRDHTLLIEFAHPPFRQQRASAAS